jgi:cystathionine beta-lyase/cystathionine gamma-synthase
MRIDPRDVAICAADDPATAGHESAPGPDGIPAPVVPPIVQTSLFAFGRLDALVEGLGAESRTSVYTRGRNPTVGEVERRIAALERGEACLCFGSGMAAISSVMLGLLRAGDHVLFVNDTYGPTLQLADHLQRFGISHDLVLDLDPAAVERAIRPETRLLWLESPGTMRFRVLDVAACAALAKERGILTGIDNSWATPLCQKPIELGVDLVMHTASKYLGGHSDLIAGAVVSTAARIEEIFHRAYLLNGGVLGPFDAWLLLRGIRTLPVRLRQHETDALAVAKFLLDHPAVHRVFHPAFAEGEEARLVARQLSGTTGLLSFELAGGDYASVRRAIDGLRRFRIGVSWGGVESLVISPNRGTNGERLDALGIPRGLVRLSVGLEGADLLVEDLAAALAPLT